MGGLGCGAKGHSGAKRAHNSEYQHSWFPQCLAEAIAGSIRFIILQDPASYLLIPYLFVALLFSYLIVAILKTLEIPCATLSRRIGSP